MLTLVQIDRLGNGEKGEPFSQFVYILAMQYHHEQNDPTKRLGMRQIMSATTTPAIRAHIVPDAPDLPQQTTPEQKDRQAAKAMLWAAFLSSLNQMTLGNLVYTHPDLTEFLIEVVEEYAKIKNPAVLNPLKNLQEMVDTMDLSNPDTDTRGRFDRLKETLANTITLLQA